MMGLIRTFALFFMGCLSFYFYYNFYPWHGEDKTFFYVFLLLNLSLYLCYKCCFLLFPKTRTHIHGGHIILFFLAELFFLCLCFFGFQEQPISLGFFVFFKITFVLFLLSLFWAGVYSFGKTILSRLNIFHPDEKIAYGLTSLGLGFSLFILGVFFLGFVGLYNATAVFFWFVLIITISYKMLGDTYDQITTPFLTYEHDIDITASFAKKINIGRVIDELHLGIITFLLSINFINVYRPFPIGWDDLGVYMNFPRLLAQSGELLALGKMYFWELYTGIGFLGGSQMFSFFLNSFSGVIVSIVIYFSLSSLFHEKKSLFNIPLLCVLITLAMPMTIFQLAKDMKLDYGLLSISVICLFLLYHILFSEHHKTTKQRLFLFGILGFFIGIAFSIKLTSLLILLGTFGVLFFVHFSLLGFLGFLSLFFGTFTLLGLWSMMNIITPEISSGTKIFFSVAAIGLGVICTFLGYLERKHKHKNMLHLLQEISMVFLGFILVLIPWGIKHITELNQSTILSVGTLLNGNPDQFLPDYTKIYSPEEFSQKTELLTGNFTSKGKVNNEDFGRYFGYEEGINNYLKLPWNLTFQVNQKGEFTDITFLFFALIPLVFLFLPFRKKWYMYPLLVGEGLLLLYYIPSPVSGFLTQMFSQASLPGGYVIIFLFFVLPFLYLFTTLERSEKLNQIFLVNFAFSTVYVFLWSISSFGIVWYGILMYYVFLIMLATSLYAAYDTDKKQQYIGTYIVLGIVWVYILTSTIPHGVSNLRSAGYLEYKLGKHTEEISLMSFHPDYFNFLYTLNIHPDKHGQIFGEYKGKFTSIIEKLPDAQEFIATIQMIQSTPQLVDLLSQLSRYSLSPQVDEEIQILRQELYEMVMNTPKELKNDAIVYRVGTFLKYFISENHNRVFEDSLLVTFDTYLADTNQDIAFERFKKLGFSYVLLDLNAATIDQDPAQNLTKRYESMLSFLTHPKFEMVESDSVCLKLGLDVYKETQDTNIYLTIAGVNFGAGNLKQQKYYACLDAISRLLVDDKVSLEKYSYLLPYKNALVQLKINPQDIDAVRNGIAPYLQNGYKALFKITEIKK